MRNFAIPLLASVLVSPAWCNGARVDQAWRVYSTCLAAYVEVAAVQDLGSAAIKAEKWRELRVPMLPRLVILDARDACSQFRAELNGAYLSDHPGRTTELIKKERALLTSLEGLITGTQKSWTEQGYFLPHPQR